MTESENDPLEGVIPETIEVATLPRDGTVVAIAPDADTLARIAAAFGIVAVDAFAAELTVRPFRRNGASLKGRLEADVVQSCVVTLEPVPQHLDEDIDLTFLPPEDAARRKPEDELDIDPDAEDPPEILEHGRIDLGTVLLEHFALGLDPYPRKEGAFLPEEEAGDAAGRDDPPPSPFAALKRLKSNDGS
ncbi:uncharacterized protein GGD81_003871 [Rhodobium orientis]|uniref:DUF177 domain-containing protein n=1 Tax=Rhodobium orientis TaxID=34017 RepID=A0A327JP06_9HYPH|nr:DUF177 domain-containing protein [Rhodobium orientis]MBB4304807.1 uncharacterized protein [Rhodobium orientis]MBK5948019.1 hypothetical protein [Rhodobium orientis]RAI27455.1 hypothetical protein CH339_10205 [Rhodobium orientis]